MDEIKNIMVETRSGVKYTFKLPRTIRGFDVNQFVDTNTFFWFVLLCQVCGQPEIKEPPRSRLR